MYDQKYQSNQISSMGREIKTLKLTTGFQIIYNEQLKLLDNRGMHEQIVKRKRWTTKMIRYCLGYENCHSDLYFDLNRVSPLLSIDRKLVEIICKYINVDGYYIHTVPSLWHLGDVFHGEMATCISRNLLDYDIENVYSDTDSQKYKEKLHEAEEKYKSKKMVFETKSILVDYKTFDKYEDQIVKYIKDKSKDHHIIIYSSEASDKYKEMLDRLKELKIHKSILNIYMFIKDLEGFIKEKFKTNLNIDEIVTVDEKRKSIMVDGKNIPVINMV